MGTAARRQDETFACIHIESYHTMDGRFAIDLYQSDKNRIPCAICWTIVESQCLVLQQTISKKSISSFFKWIKSSQCDIPIDLFNSESSKQINKCIPVKLLIAWCNREQKSVTDEVTGYWQWDIDHSYKKSMNQTKYLLIIMVCWVSISFNFISRRKNFLIMFYKSFTWFWRMKWHESKYLSIMLHDKIEPSEEVY